jgi:hypothetical protein
MRRTTTALVTTALAVGLALTGCSQGGTTGAAGSSAPTDRPASPTASATADATASTPESAPTGTATPRSTGSGSVPSTCAGLITAGKWDDSFAAAPINHPDIVGDPIVIPKSGYGDALEPAGKRISCTWMDPRADISHVTIRVETVDPAAATDVLRKLSGYDCADRDGGYGCQKVSRNPQYPVTDGDTFFTRGDIGIEIEQSNAPTDGLLDDVIAHVF